MISQLTVKSTLIRLICVIALSASSLCAEEIKPFDWSSQLAIPPGDKYTKGNQILHFKSKNKHYSENQSAALFVEEHLENAKQAESDAEVLKIGSDEVSINGAYIELGVCTGKTINFIAALNPSKTIYGFDSFEGLPEDWIREDMVISKGTFGYKDSSYVPPVLHNVCLYKDWFKNSLPSFKNEMLKDTSIAFLHIDSDIYSSAKEAFDFLGENIKEGTIIVFDELYI